MSVIDPDLLDEMLPEEAVKGLDEATRRAREAGRPMVVVRDGKLVRLVDGEVVVLKEMPARRKVAGHEKTAAGS